jgi:hypothetical protein
MKTLRHQLLRGGRILAIAAALLLPAGLHGAADAGQLPEELLEIDTLFGVKLGEPVSGLRTIGEPSIRGGCHLGMRDFLAVSIVPREPNPNVSLYKATFEKETGRIVAVCGKGETLDGCLSFIAGLEAIWGDRHPALRWKRGWREGFEVLEEGASSLQGYPIDRLTAGCKNGEVRIGMSDAPRIFAVIRQAEAERPEPLPIDVSGL